jgi:hypothetical protein
MKCSNPNCYHGIGLVSYQRHWFDKQRFCSKKCRDGFSVARPRPSQQERLVGSYFNWLFENAASRSASSDLQKPARMRASTIGTMARTFMGFEDLMREQHKN